MHSEIQLTALKRNTSADLQRAGIGNRVAVVGARDLAEGGRAKRSVRHRKPGVVKYILSLCPESDVDTIFYGDGFQQGCVPVA